MLTELAPLARPAHISDQDTTCRLCGARLHRTVADLGRMPLATLTLGPGESAPAHPLRVLVCDSCLLVQIQDPVPPDSGSARYAYLGASSANRCDHARRFAATMRQRLGLGPQALVIEVASNDGFLLRHFRDAGVPVLGIEPALNAAHIAQEQGIPTEIGLFNAETAMDVAVRYGAADLIIANNVLPEVPDMFDFAAGFPGILRPKGVVVFQFPHVLSLLQKTQFDAFRHDRYAYLSLLVLERVLRSVGLRVFEAERVPDHGGSLRVFACHPRGPHADRPGLKALRQAEAWAGLDRPETYGAFAVKMATARDDITEFLRVRRDAGRSVGAWGAAARGNTMLNACGITRQDIMWVADPDPAKHGRFLPAGGIEIVSPDRPLSERPDDLLILPWPNAAEIAASLLPVRQKGSLFWTASPAIRRV